MPEWERVRLGDLLIPTSSDRRENIQPDKEYRLLGVRLSNEGPFLREVKKGSDSAASSLFQVREGDFIYSRLFAWRGALGLIPLELDGCYVSNEFPLFTARDERLDLEYLNYWFHLPNVIRSIEADCTGSTPLTRNRYKESFFLALEIPLPPLSEQQRIVARIKSMLSKVEDIRNQQEGLLIDLPKAANAFIDKSILGSKTHPMMDVSEIAISVTDGDHQAPPQADSGIPFIKISNITNKYLDLSNTKFVPAEYFDSLSNSRKPRRGDVLYTAVGATYGRPCLVETHRPFCFQRHISIIRPNPELIDSHYLWWALQSDFVYQQATKGITGTAQPTVPLKTIRKIKIPVPDLATQHSIVSEISRRHGFISNAIDTAVERQTALHALPASILARAFAGEL